MLKMKTEIRSPVGHKSKLNNAMACYCFDITYKDIIDSNSSLTKYITKQTKNWII